MKKFIIKSTRWIKNGRKAGYFRDYKELIETDDILKYIRENYSVAFDVYSNYRIFCSASEVEDYFSGMFRYIDKSGGIKICREKDDIVENEIKYIYKYDKQYKGWM